MQKVTFNAEIAKDPKFDIQLQGVIEEIKAEHTANVEKYGANNLKANPLSRMLEAGELTVEFLKAEFPKVANKQSNLSASKRELVAALVYNAAQRTVLLKREERAQRIAEKANTRVAAEEAGETTAPNQKPKGSKRKLKKQAKRSKK